MRGTRKTLGEGVRPVARRTRGRRAVVSVLAMLYLVLFAALAVGFYTTTTLSAQIAWNEKRMTAAQAAAESGMEFVRYKLSKVNITAATNDAEVLDKAYEQLNTQLVGTANLGISGVGYDGTTIMLPKDAEAYVELEAGGPQFRAAITRVGRELNVVVTGRGGPKISTRVVRGVQTRFRINEKPSSIFSYGMATKGPLSLNNGFVTGSPNLALGRVLVGGNSATPLSMSGSGSISGTLEIANASGTISGSGSIGGVTDPGGWVPPLVTKGVTMPEFPTLDPTPYINYLAGRETIITASSTAPFHSNIRIKAGTNPTFSSGPTIKGVILIEAPNRVSFSGGVNIEGVIVVANPTEATSTNAIIISGQGSVKGPEGLPVEYGELRQMGGAVILGPNFGLEVSGGSASFGGSIIAKSITLSGGSAGTASGTVITTGTAATSWSGGSGFTISALSAQRPAGIRFSGNFGPVRGSYREVVVP